MRWTFFLVFLLGYTPAGFAQSSDWVIVPTSTDDEASWMRPTVTTMRDALSRKGVRVLSVDQTVALFEKKGSATSTEMTDTDIEEWVARSRGAIRHLARGDYSTALKELKKAQQLSRKAVDELNREQTRAQNVLDTCLYMVRALLETRNRPRAKSQVQECVRLVPRSEPSEHMHPPNVVALYREASAPGPDQTGSLRVDSEPAGCDVRINGVRFGQTPFEMGDLYPGDYQVQVECDPGRRGRVHPVSIQAGEKEVFVDMEFDAVLRSDSLLRLRYANDRINSQRRTDDAQEIAKVLNSEAVVLASVLDDDTLELRIVSGSERRGGLVRIPTTRTGPTATVAAQAATALIEGDCKDFTGSKPVTISCKTAASADQRKVKRKKKADFGADWPADRPPRAQWITGLTLASVGAASLAISYGLLIARRGKGDDWIDNFAVADATSRQRQAEWVNLGNGLIYPGVAGGALATAAMPMVLPYRSETPWWAWLSGGLGVGAATVAIISAITAEDLPVGSKRCNRIIGLPVAQNCVDRNRSTDRAILLGTTAAPLLTIPLVYLLRKGEKKQGASIAPGITVGRGSGAVSLRGRF